MKKQILAALFAVLSVFGYAQLTEHEVRQMTHTATEQELVTECSRMLQENYFFYAEIIVDRLLQINLQSSNYHYRKGYIVLDSRLDYETAMSYLFKATLNVKRNYDMYSAKELGAPTDVYYHLARCYHLDEQLEKAKEFYQKFIDESAGKSELIPKAKVRLVQCDVAKELIASPKPAKVTNVGSNVNTVYPEYAPVISLDGTSLYFTSRRQWADESTDDYRDPQLNQYPEDIYTSTKDINGDWSKPERLSFCEGRLNEASVSISADERMIYTYEDRTGSGDIYFSDFQRNEFQLLKMLDNKNVNTKYWETHVSVTPDGQQMYFVSDRPGGYGKRDIYRIVKLPNGQWSEPINLGPNINSEHDEDSPFIAVDNKTLYFSSNGPTSMGEFDIFVSVRDENDKWSMPINLGYPINSTGDDIFYTTTADGLLGYLTSFRKKGFGEKDIYRIDNDYLGIKNAAVLTGKIFTSDGSPMPESVFMELTCNNCDDKRKIELLPRLRDGLFFSNLTPCREYTISYFSEKGSEFVYSENLSTKCNAGYEEIYKELMFDVNRKRIIPNVRYTMDGIISEAKTGVGIPGAIVEIENKATGEVYEKLIANDKGYYVSKYPDNAAYGDKIDFSVKVSKEEFLTQHLDLKVVLTDKLEYHLACALEKPEVGIDLAEVLHLKPIYFDLDKSDIRPDAEIELNKIIEIMNDNPKINNELGSHTDCRSSFDYNLKLSDRRAAASVGYIQKQITNPGRIYGKGYSESQLVNDCECEGKIVSKCSDEEHQQNRRTEFRIVQ